MARTTVGRRTGRETMWEKREKVMEGEHEKREEEILGEEMAKKNDRIMWRANGRKYTKGRIKRGRETGGGKGGAGRGEGEGEMEGTATLKEELEHS